MFNKESCLHATKIHSLISFLCFSTEVKLILTVNLKLNTILHVLHEHNLRSLKVSIMEDISETNSQS